MRVTKTFVFGFSLQLLTGGFRGFHICGILCCLFLTQDELYRKGIGQLNIPNMKVIVI